VVLIVVGKVVRRQDGDRTSRKMVHKEVNRLRRTKLLQPRRRVNLLAVVVFVLSLDSRRSPGRSARSDTGTVVEYTNQTLLFFDESG
jgi:hypothetical protein